MTHTFNPTRHDYFAAAALTGLAAIYVEVAKRVGAFGSAIDDFDGHTSEAKIITGIARIAHKLADAMMEEERGK